jgi:hypothetical protein
VSNLAQRGRDGIYFLRHWMFGKQNDYKRGTKGLQQPGSFHESVARFHCAAVSLQSFATLAKCMIILLCNLRLIIFCFIFNWLSNYLFTTWNGIGSNFIGINVNLDWSYFAEANNVKCISKAASMFGPANRISLSATNCAWFAVHTTLIKISSNSRVETSTYQKIFKSAIILDLQFKDCKKVPKTCKTATKSKIYSGKWLPMHSTA